MDDDVKKVGLESKLKRAQSEWSHQSAMHNVSSPELNHAKFWTTGELGNINQNWSIMASAEHFCFHCKKGSLTEICLFLCFLRRGNSSGLKCHIVKAIKTDLEWENGLECADLRNLCCFGIIPLNLMPSFCSD